MLNNLVVHIFNVNQTFYDASLSTGRVAYIAFQAANCTYYVRLNVKLLQMLSQKPEVVVQD